MKDCKECKHLVYCDPYKMMFHAQSGEECDGFAEQGEVKEERKPRLFTAAEVRHMTEEQVKENFNAIFESMKRW